MELPSLFKPSSVSTLVLTSQVGADSISWYFALRECWTDTSLLPVQEELLYSSELLTAQEELSRGIAGSTPVTRAILTAQAPTANRRR